MTDDKPGTKTEKSPALKENIIRLVTVCAYVSSVSMAAMCLSSYYIFFWEPKPPGPGPPIIHPHAYVSDPYPPLKLVAPLPDDDSQGASFWQSVRSYFQPDETTTKPPETTRERAEQTTLQDMTPPTITPEVDNSTDPMGIEIPSMIILEANSNSHLDKEVSDTVLEHEANMPMHQGYVGVIPNRAKRGKRRHVEPSTAETREDSNKSDNVKTDMTEHTSTEQGTKNAMAGTQNEQITEVIKDSKDKDHTRLLNERIETQANNQSELKQSTEKRRLANSDPTTKGPNEDGIRFTHPIGYLVAKRADFNATTNNGKDKAHTATRTLKENTTESTLAEVHELQDETTVTQSRYETVTQLRDQTVTQSRDQTVTQSQDQTILENLQSTNYKLAKRDITTNDPTMDKDVSKAFTTFGNNKSAIKELKNQGTTLNPEIELFSNMVLYTKAIDAMIKETPNDLEDKTLQTSTNKQTGENAETVEGLTRQVNDIVANTELTTERPNEDGVKSRKAEPTEVLSVGDTGASTTMSPHTVLTHMEHPVNDPQYQHHLRPRRRFPGVPGH